MAKAARLSEACRDALYTPNIVGTAGLQSTLLSSTTEATNGRVGINLVSTQTFYSFAKPPTWNAHDGAHG